MIDFTFLNASVLPTEVPPNFNIFICYLLKNKKAFLKSERLLSYYFVQIHKRTLLQLKDIVVVDVDVVVVKMKFIIL